MSEEKRSQNSTPNASAKDLLTQKDGFKTPFVSNDPFRSIPDFSPSVHDDFQTINGAKSAVVRAHLRDRKLVQLDSKSIKAFFFVPADNLFFPHPHLVALR